MARLKTQLNNTDEIRKILQELNIAWSWGDEDVDVRLIYLPCVSKKCDTSPLLTIIKNCLLTNFALSHKEIQKKLEITSSESEEALFNKAVRSLSKNTAHGELGELLLFTLLETYLGAPKILSKIANKSSRRVAVHGADAVHAQYVNGKLRLYLGESKLRKTFSSSIGDAISSIVSARDNYDREFDLIESHIDFPEITGALEKELLSVLNPFNNTLNIIDILYSPCFIGFAEPTCFLDEASYLDTYQDIAAGYISSYYSRLQKQNIHHNKSTLFLLPFHSIDDLVNEFILYMGIQK